MDDDSTRSCAIRVIPNAQQCPYTSISVHLRRLPLIVSGYSRKNYKQFIPVAVVKLTQSIVLELEHVLIGNQAQTKFIVQYI